jgi:ADP-ribose pyrophosphatase YjhB (NUDIX family)
MENGETTVEGALRETVEESRVQGLNPELLSMVSLPDFDQVHVFYRVDMPDFSFETTPESSEVVLFNYPDIPWEDIAFLTVKVTLEHYLEHLESDSVPVLNSVVHRPRHYRE